MTPDLPSPPAGKSRLLLRFWVVTVAAVVVAATTFSLGQWQLRRAAQKEDLQQAIVSKNTLPPLDTAALAAEPDLAADVHRPARVQGTWDAAHTVYLDNRPMGERVGFWVLTPLRLAGSSQVIMVQRGWVPRNFVDRTRLPDITTPTGLVTVEGRMAPRPARLYAFKGADTGRIRQNLELDAFRAETGLNLMPGALLQVGGPSEGLLRDWAPPQLGVEKNYGYAFQWFALCALAVGLFGWFQIFVPWRNRSRAGTRNTISS